MEMALQTQIMHPLPFSCLRTEISRPILRLIPMIFSSLRKQAVRSRATAHLNMVPMPIFLPPDTGYSFSRWTGSGVHDPLDFNTTVHMTEDRNISAF